MTNKKPKIIAIVGTNASGKSALAMKLALRFSGEIVSADSRQVYQGFDLAAGKPRLHELQEVRHHLINIVPLDVRFSLADYQRLAYQALDDIISRHLTPLLVGGTGLYVRSVVDGYQLADVRPNFALRNSLEQLPNPTLWEQLSFVDPQAAEQIDPRNRRRVIRALEIIESGHTFATSHINKPKYGVLQLGLTWPRDELRRRIMLRLRQRISQGLITEFEVALKRGVSHDRLESLGLEYRYVSRYIRGSIPTLDELIDELGHAIYRFAARQIAWFRHDKSIVWLDVNGDYEAEAASRIEMFLTASSSD